MIAALALSLLLAGGQAQSPPPGWTDGPPPNPGPTTGRFIWMGLTDAPQTKAKTNLYLLAPDAPAADGQVMIWTLIIQGAGGQRIYSLARQTIDCDDNQSTRPEIQVYAKGQAVGWVAGEERMYAIPSEKAFLNKSRDLACGPLPADAVIVTDLAGALADSDARLTAEK